MGGALAIFGDSDESFTQSFHVGWFNLEVVPQAVGVGGEDFIVETLNLLHEACLVKLPSGSKDSISLSHLEWGDDDVTLPNAHVGKVASEDFPFLNAEHVGVVGDIARVFRLPRFAQCHQPAATASPRALSGLDGAV
jgi:hypothetical protein